MSVARIFPSDRVARSGDGELDLTSPGVLELERKIINLERALASQRTIGIAVGLLAQRHACTSEQAWEHLRKISQITNLKVRDVARVLRDASDGDLREDDAEVLAAVRRCLSDAFPGDEAPIREAGSSIDRR